MAKSIRELEARNKFLKTSLDSSLMFVSLSTLLTSEFAHFSQNTSDKWLRMFLFQVLI